MSVIRETIELDLEAADEPSELFEFSRPFSAVPWQDGAERIYDYVRILWRSSRA